MAESEALNPSNLQLSSDVLVISPESQVGQLTLTNLHQSYHLYFKIKTKIQKVFDVKPVLGSIKPGEKIVLAFKASQTIEPSQFTNLEQKLQFLIQAVNSSVPQMSREEQQNLWKEVKQQKHLELGYISIKLPIKFTKEPVQQTRVIAHFGMIQSKINSKFSSNLKSSKTSSRVKDQNFGDSSVKNINKPIPDKQLSQKYEQLKTQELKLVRQRQRIFEAPLTSGGPKKKVPKVQILVVFIITFLLGNFLKGVFADRQPEPQVQEENSLFGWFS